MHKNVVRNIIILLLASSLLFLGVRYILSLKGEIKTLEHQKQNLLQDLEKEKMAVQDLNAKNTVLKKNLRVTYNRLNKSFREIDAQQTKIEQLDSKFSLLKAENSALLTEKDSLVKENEGLKVKLSSLKELKKAIWELKYGKTQVEGNRGYLIKDGQSTAIAKVKIEVSPASESNNERNTSSAVSK